jgi:hypothetical protein
MSHPPIIAGSVQLIPIEAIVVKVLIGAAKPYGTMQERNEYSADTAPAPLKL